MLYKTYNMGKVFSKCASSGSNQVVPKVEYHKFFKDLKIDNGKLSSVEELFLNEILSHKDHKLFILYLRYYGPDFLFGLNAKGESAFDLLPQYFTEEEREIIETDYNVLCKSEYFYGTENLINLLKYCQKHEIYLNTQNSNAVKEATEVTALPRLSLTGAFDIDETIL